MKPIKRTITGAASLVIPLNHMGEVGCSYYADVAVIVKPLADKSDITSIIDTIASATSGNFNYSADAILVTTTGTTSVIVNQSG